MSKALYRKYRPTKLGDVVGQEGVVKALQQVLKQGKISHAYLFTGARGTGKTTIARIFAHEINGFKYELEDDYVDIIEIDAASNRGIDDIRELRERAAVAPTTGKYKVYILDESHMLTKEASNALLKVLEEPPAHVVFIMATTNIEKVLPTIVSRSQVYNFSLAEPAVMKEYLAKIAKKEKLKIADGALEIIVRKGGGSFRDSLSLLDQLSTLSEGEITTEAVEQAMGLPREEILDRLLAAYGGGDVVEITTILKDALNTGVMPAVLAEELVERIIAKPTPELLPLLAKLPDVAKPLEPFPEAQLLLALATSTQTRELAATSPADAASRQPKVSSDETGVAEAGAAEPERPFDWNTFLEKVKEKSYLLYNILSSSKHQLEADTLVLYVKNPGIINSENNRKLLQGMAGKAIEGRSIGELSGGNFGAVSDIMGNVEEVKDAGNPFK